MNAVEALVQGGCRAIAEDTMNVVSEVETQLQTAGGVAIVVTTPDFTRNGAKTGALPCDTKLVISLIIILASRRTRENIVRKLFSRTGERILRFGANRPTA